MDCNQSSDLGQRSNAAGVNFQGLLSVKFMSGSNGAKPHFDEAEAQTVPSLDLNGFRWDTSGKSLKIPWDGLLSHFSLSHCFC